MSIVYAKGRRRRNLPTTNTTNTTTTNNSKAAAGTASCHNHLCTWWFLICPVCIVIQCNISHIMCHLYVTKDFKIYRCEIQCINCLHLFFWGKSNIDCLESSTFQIK
jgi:hypothetical protein